MAIEYRERDGGTGPDVVTTTCPACGKDREEWPRNALPFHLPNCPKRGEL